MGKGFFYGLIFEKRNRLEEGEEGADFGDFVVLVAGGVAIG